MKRSCLILLAILTFFVMQSMATVANDKLPDSISRQAVVEEFKKFLHIDKQFEQDEFEPTKQYKERVNTFKVEKLKPLLFYISDGSSWKYSADEGEFVCKMMLPGLSTKNHNKKHKFYDFKIYEYSKKKSDALPDEKILALGELCNYVYYLSIPSTNFAKSMIKRESEYTQYLILKVKCDIEKAKEMKDCLITIFEVEPILQDIINKDDGKTRYQYIISDISYLSNFSNQPRETTYQYYLNVNLKNIYIINQYTREIYKIFDMNRLKNNKKGKS